MAEPVSRRHHTVPRFYLEGFASDSRITTVDLSNGRSYPGSTKDASVWTSFYDLPDHPDGSDVFEKALSKIESAAAAVLRKIVEERVWPLPPPDRQVFAEFMTLQVLRGPNERQRMEEIVAAVTQAEYTMGGRRYARGKLDEKVGRPVTDDEFDELWADVRRPGGPPVKLTPQAHIDQLLTLLPQIISYVAGRPWTLFRFARRSLLTGDTPLMAIPDGQDELSGGLMTAKALTLPLTRKIGVFLGDPLPIVDALHLNWGDVASGRADTATEGSTAVEKLFNARTIASATRFIFHHPDDVHLVPSKLPRSRDRQMDITDTDFTREPQEEEPFSPEPLRGC